MWASWRNLMDEFLMELQNKVFKRMAIKHETNIEKVHIL